ncbi:hypothetical protein N7489_003412 [Penicillium chrysogenum]|uniref:Uncharacterized protein n=1 Tax=Penicillium chrysogenum TaxID=5076 RepID=A0ABQ8W8H8_PENCH|nr:uncharacterized protein N7489_003412 [Penicillium chrysogenum]KAJ5253002.1 hypothetical protein N7489_003412 [Penicillium chrysogenum]KAJ5260229.1 hypothetical protein N7505_009610 [Penicillium chrysogenum]
MGRKESIFENHLAEAILKSSDSSELSSPNYPGSLQGSEYDSSDDDAGDYPYRNDGEDGTQVVITRTNPSAKKDPGPSVRVRTAAELDAVIKAQVEDGSEQSGDVPSWVIAAVAERRPSSPLPQKRYAGKDAAATGKPAKLTSSRKRSAAVANLNTEQVDQAPELAAHEYTPSRHEIPSSPIQPAKETPRVREAAVLKRTPVADKEQPAKRRKSEAGPANASEGTTKDEPKRRKSEVVPAKASEGTAKDEPPKLKNGGLPFNATWYNSPLEDPKVYSMKDKDYALDTYNDLADLIARVTEDHGRMKAALLKKGFLLESDEESEEENVFAVD